MVEVASPESTSPVMALYVKPCGNRSASVRLRASWRAPQGRGAIRRIGRAYYKIALWGSVVNQPPVRDRFRHRQSGRF